MTTTQKNLKKLVTEFFEETRNCKPFELFVHGRSEASFGMPAYEATANTVQGPWAVEFADWVEDNDRYQDLHDAAEIIEPLSDYEVGLVIFDYAQR